MKSVFSYVLYKEFIYFSEIFSHVKMMTLGEYTSLVICVAFMVCKLCLIMCFLTSKQWRWCRMLTLHTWRQDPSLH